MCEHTGLVVDAALALTWWDGEGALARCKTQDGPDWSGYMATRGIPGSPDEEVVTALTVLQLGVELTGR